MVGEEPRALLRLPSRHLCSRTRLDYRRLWRTPLASFHFPSMVYGDRPGKTRPYGRTIQGFRDECLMAANGLRPGLCPGEFRVVVFRWAQTSWTVLMYTTCRARCPWPVAWRSFGRLSNIYTFPISVGRDQGSTILYERMTRRKETPALASQ